MRIAGLPDFRVTSSRQNGRTTVVVSGELDMATTAVFTGEVRERLDAGPVSLDLGDLTFLDSAGVHALDDLLRAARSAGHTLSIRPHLRPPVRQVLEMTRLLEVLPMEEEEQA